MNTVNRKSLVLVGLFLLLPVMATAANPTNDLNEERRIIGRALIEVQSTNWPQIMPYYAKDITYHDPIVTIEGHDMMTEFLARMFTNSPDLVTTIEDESCVDGIYTATWEMVGYFGEVPYSAKGMSIVKFRPGETQVFYQRDYYTESDIMINIPGLAEPATAFRTYYRCAVDPAFDCPEETQGGNRTAEEQMDKSQLQVPFKLGQNSPNPFNPSTTISFEIPEGGSEVDLRVYDVSGRLVRTLVDGYQSGGNRQVSWNGRNEQGRPMPSGVYYYQLMAPEFSEKRKMVLLK